MQMQMRMLQWFIRILIDINSSIISKGNILHVRQEWQETTEVELQFHVTILGDEKNRSTLDYITTG